MIDVEYVPPLSVEHYVDRLVKAFALDSSLKAEALEIESRAAHGTRSNALIEASSAVILAAKHLTVKIKACDVARHVGVSTLAA